MRFNKYFIPAAALAIVFFFNFSSVLAGGPGGGITAVDSVLKTKWTVETHDISKVRFSPDDSYIITSGGTEDLRIYNVENGNVIDTINSGNGASFSGFTFSRSGKYLIAQAGGEVKVYDPKSFQLLKTLRDTATWFKGEIGNFYVDISPDDKYISLASNNIFYTVWEWQTGKVVKREEMPLITPERNYDNCRLSVANFTMDNNFLYISGNYHYSANNQSYTEPFIKIMILGTWDTITPTVVRIGGRLSRTGKLACGYYSGKIKIWETTNYTLIKEIPTVSTNSITNVAISSDDKYVVMTTYDHGETYIYKIENGELIFMHPGDGLSSPDVSLDNKYIVCSLYYYLKLVIPPWTSIGVQNPIEPTETIYPNPANGNVSINLAIPRPMNLEAGIYDSKGTKLRTIPLGVCSGSAVLNVENVPSGAYTLLISGEGYNKAFRMMVAK